jgi:apolipoprotein N-acyltransferase
VSRFILSGLCALILSSFLCYPSEVRRIQPSAWALTILSAVLQVVIFPLPNLYWLSWVAVTPLLIALLRARPAGPLQLDAAMRLVAASPRQGFALAYLSGVLWSGGTCYWIFDTMHRYGGLSVPAAAFALLLFCMYIGLYHGLFGFLLALMAAPGPLFRRALVAAPFLWVAVELARTRVTGFPWELLGYAQTSNIALTRVATLTGVYGPSFEIVLVNSVFAAAFVVAKERRNGLLLAACAGALLLQMGQWIMKPPASPADRVALLVQPNIPIVAEWTGDYFQRTVWDLAKLSVETPGQHDIVVWPESPSPFFTNDARFRDPVSAMARLTQSWVVTGAIGIASGEAGQRSRIYNSAELVSPEGNWTARYDKVHLVPFGEYLPFPKLFGFAGGLTREVGEFQKGSSREPLDAGGERLGTFICYESIFPDEVRQFPLAGAQVLVNISNDGWYGDSGAWKQHLQQTRMRAIENDRWILSATNTGLTAVIDPWGRVTAEVPRKERTALNAPYGLISGTTFYTRRGDWFAYLCAIISLALVAGGLVLPAPKEQSKKFN